jgi:hypothetical protein
LAALSTLPHETIADDYAMALLSAIRTLRKETFKHGAAIKHEYAPNDLSWMDAVAEQMHTIIALEKELVCYFAIQMIGDGERLATDPDVQANKAQRIADYPTDWNLRLPRPLMVMMFGMHLIESATGDLENSSYIAEPEMQGGTRITIEYGYPPARGLSVFFEEQEANRSAANN